MKEKTLKYCNCHFSNNNEILSPKITNSFCQKCGSILIKDKNGNINYTLKPKHKQKPVEYNPIDFIKTMKKRTEKDYPYLNNEYNCKNKNRKEELHKTIELYLNQRKMIILNLQKMMKMLDFSDLTFYQCLFFIDLFLSHRITEDTKERDILYYLVGFFLCSCKLRETDIYEPTLDCFCDIKNKIYLSEDIISLYEVKCLKIIKYNIFSYSAYEWVHELINNGFIFNGEINNSQHSILVNGKKIINVSSINKYIMKMLLNITVKNIYIKFSPQYIAFSLLLIARDKYLDKNLAKPKLFEELIGLYGVKLEDFKKCYTELKEEIEEKKNNFKNTENETNEQLLGEFESSNKKKPIIKHNSLKNDLTFRETKGKSSSKTITDTKIELDEIKEQNIDFDLNEMEKSEKINKTLRTMNSTNYDKKHNKTKLFINCHNVIQNNDNFKRLNSLNMTSQKFNKKEETENMNNLFLKTHQKQLGPIKNKKELIASDGKLLYSYSNKKNDENFNNTPKNLFTENTFVDRKLSSKELFLIRNPDLKQTFTNRFHKTAGLEDIIKGEEKNESVKGIDNLKQRWNSKNKINDNKLKSKEIKIFVNKRRNQSLNQIKRKTISCKQ